MVEEKGEKMGSGKGSGKWEVGSGKWEAGSGKRGAGSRKQETGVASGNPEARSGRIVEFCEGTGMQIF
jgi:hypothetical protein